MAKNFVDASALYIINLLGRIMYRKPIYIYSAQKTITERQIMKQMKEIRFEDMKH